MTGDTRHVVWFENLGRGDVARVGGKNASLGEMVGHLGAQGVSVPPGFATTADAYWRFVEANRLLETTEGALDHFKAGKGSLQETGQDIRRAFLRGDWPDETAREIHEAYRELSNRSGAADSDVAVRSSATAEDPPDASFAGQQEGFLNIRGETALLDACRRCYASLITDRAISYREAKGFDQLEVALSVGVQKLVRSDLDGAGVRFSIDTESGFDKVAVIDAAWGLGENVVQGTVDPDKYQVFKPLLDDTALAPVIRSAQEIERFEDGAILVTETTAPDWVPIMQQAAAIVTDHSGRTSHAAIVSRELGLPAIVGTGDATEILHDDQDVTFSCAEGDKGFVYEGIGAFEVAELSFDDTLRPRTAVMLSLANPAGVLRLWGCRPTASVSPEWSSSWVTIVADCVFDARPAHAQEFLGRLGGNLDGDADRLLLGDQPAAPEDQLCAVEDG